MTLARRVKQLHRHWKSGIECCSLYSLAMWAACLASSSYYRPMIWGFAVIISCWLAAIVFGDFLHSLYWLLSRRLRQRRPWLVYGGFVWNLLQVMLVVAMLAVAVKIYIR